MRSQFLYSVAGVLMSLAVCAQAQSQAEVRSPVYSQFSKQPGRIVSLNPLSAQQAALQPPRLLPISALSTTSDRSGQSADTLAAPRLGKHELEQLLQGYINRFNTDPDPYVQAAIELYGQTGGALIWHRTQGWIPAAVEAYRILSQAGYDGLPAEKYLRKISKPLADLRTEAQVVQADFALTLGVLRFAMDLKFGLDHDISPGTLGEAFRVAYSSNQIEAWIDGFRPETALYLRLHKALLLEELTPEQMDKAAITLHRERTPFIVHPERQIVVDVGLQELVVYENRREVMSMPVVVGKPDRRTPLLSDKIVNLKFSPDWSVPPLIVREDLLPILREDPSLLKTMGIQVLDADGREVAAEGIDWKTVPSHAVPYRFRMAPGIDNLLGGVRFSLTNDQAIFLHDSPERDSYGDDVRSFSSGCVRVSDSASLASWIMGRQKNWERADVISAMVRGKTQIEVLPHPIAVDFIYSTVGMTDEGTLYFKPDIYGEDASLARSLGLAPDDVPPPLPKLRRR